MLVLVNVVWMEVLGVWMEVMGELLVLGWGEWESMKLGMNDVLRVLRLSFLELC